ncbi:hypothetical protein ABPG74_019841 [Tetrahymena malaccensis]
MRIFAFALLVLTILSAVHAQTAEEYKKIFECMDKIEKESPCKPNDDSCRDAERKADKCAGTCSMSSNSLAEIRSCYESKCSSPNKDVQAFLDKKAQCLGSSIISFAFAVLISAFALLY